jgi:hypothetical protein
MSADKLDVLISVPSEIEAAAIISVLSERGIEATATGGLTAGFKAEAPGAVNVLVANADAERAKLVLDEFRTEPITPEQAGGTIFFECESCHEQVSFPGSARGTIESCPECGEWLDVPEG